jgi:hypothetical protein
MPDSPTPPKGAYRLANWNRQSFTTTLPLDTSFVNLQRVRRRAFRALRRRSAER